jgi:hypothetical protein
LLASLILLASLLHIAVIPAVAGAPSATLASAMPLFSLLLLHGVPEACLLILLLASILLLAYRQLSITGISAADDVPTSIGAPAVLCC